MKNNKDNYISLICVGNELFYNVLNTNVHIASRVCGLNGFDIGFNIIVPDNIKEIVRAVDFCLKNSSLLMISGGLGPTFDDITREAISIYMERKLIFSSCAWEEIQQRFRERKMISIPEKNRKQAMIIEGADFISNSVGTAPGMMVKHNDKLIFLLPGPPWEFEEMLKNSVIPILKKTFLGHSFIRKVFGIAGESEVVVEEKTDEIRDIIKSFGGEWTILAKPHLVELWLKVPYSKKELFNQVENFLKKTFNDSFLGDCSIPEGLASVLKEKKLVCCFAESCTGGLAGHLMTELPGVSQCFNGSIVAYSNRVKRRILRVSRSTLKKYGAVSEQTAIAMAKGARKYGKADVSLAITGIAGPEGGSIEKPVGLVCMAVALSNRQIQTKVFHFTGQRSIIKLRSALAGIDFLRRAIIKDF